MYTLMVFPFFSNHGICFGLIKNKLVKIGYHLFNVNVQFVILLICFSVYLLKKMHLYKCNNSNSAGFVSSFFLLQINTIVLFYVNNRYQIISSILFYFRCLLWVLVTYTLEMVVCNRYV